VDVVKIDEYHNVLGGSRGPEKLLDVTDRPEKGSKIDFHAKLAVDIRFMKWAESSQTYNVSDPDGQLKEVTATIHTLSQDESTFRATLTKYAEQLVACWSDLRLDPDFDLVEVETAGACDLVTAKTTVETSASNITEELGKRLDDKKTELEQIQLEQDRHQATVTALEMIQTRAGQDHPDGVLGTVESLLYLSNQGVDGAHLDPAEMEKMTLLVPRGSISRVLDARLIMSSDGPYGLPGGRVISLARASKKGKDWKDQQVDAVDTWCRSCPGVKGMTHDFLELVAFAIKDKDGSCQCTRAGTQMIVRRLCQNEVILEGKRSDFDAFVKKFRKNFSQYPVPPVLCLKDSTFFDTSGLEDAPRDGASEALLVWNDVVNADAAYLERFVIEGDTTVGDTTRVNDEIGQLETQIQQMQSIKDEIGQAWRPVSKAKAGTCTSKRRRIDNEASAAAAAGPVSGGGRRQPPKRQAISMDTGAEAGSAVTPLQQPRPSKRSKGKGKASK
jgi:hypothetical protein